MSSDATPADAKSGCDDGNDDEEKSNEVTGDGAVGDDPPEDKAPGDGAGEDAASSRGSLVSLSAYASVPDATKQQPIFMLPRERETKSTRTPSSRR